MAGNTEVIYPVLSDNPVSSMESGMEPQSMKAATTSPSTMDDETMCDSPQKKGVGLFAMGNSPRENGLSVEEIKDPKVNSLNDNEL